MQLSLLWHGSLDGFATKVWLSQLKEWGLGSKSAEINGTISIDFDGVWITS